MHGLHFLKTQMFDLIVRHILEKNIWYARIVIRRHVVGDHYLISICGGEHKIKKSSKQRYCVSCSEKTDCKALENGQRNELLRSSSTGWSSIL